MWIVGGCFARNTPVPSAAIRHLRSAFASADQVALRAMKDNKALPKCGELMLICNTPTRNTERRLLIRLH
jgi:hypothetical protein